MSENAKHSAAGVPESNLEKVLRGVAGLVHEQEAEKQLLQARCEQLEEQLQTTPLTPIIADGKQKEIIAILNVIYEAGFISGCTKAEYMKRMADALGAPGIANYTKALYNIKLTYKYDDIFTRLSEVAETEKTKND